MSEGSITIGDGTISYGSGDTVSYNSGAEITITGETNTNTVTVEYNVSANITLAGVKISSGAAAFKIADNSTGNVTITLADNTTNTLKSGNYRAGLQKCGGYISADQGKLTIQGGERGTGILNTTGGIYAAGIGGEVNKTSANITITGGVIIAAGGTGGAGIGGGSGGGNGTNITITGGTITAKGGEHGAGIGGGAASNGSNITISGGEVEANGGNNAAGIGGGIREIGSSDGGNGSDITISGGVVTAKSGENVNIAGIGGGDGGSSSGFSFTGGKIIVKKGAEIPAGYTFTIPEGAVLEISSGITLTNKGTTTNNGAIVNKGTITNNSTITNNGVITDNGTIGGGTISGNAVVPGYDGSALELSTSSVVIKKNYINYNGIDYFYTQYDDIIITGETNENTITFGYDISANITLSGVSIDVSSKENTAAFMIAENSGGNVDITLVGDNTLKSGVNCAGLQKNDRGGGGELTINGSGTLTATGGEKGAGIGGSASRYGSKITISGGTVTAIGGNKGTGIGGGYQGGGEIITISGGTVNAIGGHGAAGIGGGFEGDGSNIIISGGEVSASNGNGAAAIGAGQSAGSSNKIISGGSVKVSSGGIYNPTDSVGGNPVYPLELDTKGNPVSITTSNGNPYLAPSTHDGDNTICVYLPAGNVAEGLTNKVTLNYGKDNEVTYDYYYAENRWRIDVVAPTGFTATYGDTLDSVEFPSNTTDKRGQWAWSGEAATLVGEVGTRTFTAIYDFAADEYDNITMDITVTVNPKPITVTADNKSKTYGESDPALIYKVDVNTPLVGDDMLAGELTREAGEDVKAGGYAITQGTLTNDNNPNYDITFTPAVLTINPADPTLKDDAVLNQALLEGDGTFGEPAFVGVDGTTALTGMITYTYLDAPTAYDDIVAALSELPKDSTGEIEFAFDPASDNYNAASGTIHFKVVYVDFTVEGQPVTAANAFTIKANPTYGDSWAEIVKPNPKLTASLNGDSTTEGFSLVQTGTPNAGEQDFDIVFNGIVDNKQFTGVPVLSGTVNIAKKEVTITADNISIKVGDPIPTDFAYTVTGLVNDEPLPFTPQFASTATDSNTAGVFDITVSGDADSDNYTFSYEEGKLTISNKKVQEIIAENVTLTYGDKNGKIIASGYVGALSYTVKTGKDVISVDESGNISINKVGTATVIITAAETEEYAEATKEITVTVNKIKVDVPEKDNTTFTYNGEEQTYTIEPSDLYTVKGNTQTNADTYTVTVTLNDPEHYEWNGTLPTYTFVIEKAAVTITAKSFAIKAGDSLPALTYTSEGLKSTDKIDDIGANITIGYKDGVTPSAPGEYTIDVSGDPNTTNYTITYVDGKLTISDKAVVAVPVINPNGGTFSSSQTVTITCDTEGADIYYTTDGKDPTTASKKFNGAFKVTKTTTVKAIAFKDRMEKSAVVSAKFTIDREPTPPVDPGRPRPTDPTEPTDPKYPIINGKELSWAETIKQIQDLSDGGKLTIDLNGNTTVPANDIVEIANKDAVITFVLNAEISFVVDGAKISGKVSAIDLAVGASKTALSATNFSAIGGTAEKQFTLGSIDIPAKTSFALNKANAGKFASLMKLNSATGKYEFVSAAKITADGTALVDINSKGDYLLIVDTETKKPGDLNNDMITNALDASELLKSVVYELSMNSFKADYNIDGTATAMDASEILKVVVELIPDKFDLFA